VSVSPESHRKRRSENRSEIPLITTKNKSHQTPPPEPPENRRFPEPSYIYFFILSAEREEKRNKYIDKEKKQRTNGAAKCQTK